MKLPTLFLSHGSPLHASERSAAAEAWHGLAAALPRPRAVLMVSAHWESQHPMLGSAARPPTLHDFAGFPRELYEIRYAAPGSAELAAEAAALLSAAGMQPSQNGCRGLDHGAWVPLRWMYPDADVPVVQLSIQPERDAAHHHAAGRALEPLRARGVLVIGSGHATHHLGDWAQHRDPGPPLPYAAAFAQWLFGVLRDGDVPALLEWSARAPHAQRAHPTAEHLLPLFVALGAAGAAPAAERVFAGFEGRALAMDAYRFDS